MTSRQMKLPVTSLLPVAYWHDAAASSGGDAARRKLTRAAWENVTLTAQELSVIVLIEENTLDDSDYDIWEQVRPMIIESMGAEIDRAVLFGSGAPAGAPAGIVPQAAAAGNVLALDEGAGGYDALMGQDGLISIVENDGYIPTAHIGKISARGFLRGVKDAAGQPIFRPMSGLGAATQYCLDGLPVYFPRNGAMEGGEAKIITGDFNQLVYSIRQDVSVKLLSEAAIKGQDNEIYYLAQQNMVGLRVKMRMAWASPLPVNRLTGAVAEGGEGLEPGENCFPFAVLED
jgi:HK97 family phage major capsid protein